MPEQLTPDLLELRERLLRFIVEDLRPIDERAEGGADEDETRRQVIARSRELGFFGMTQPREVGGTQAGPLALTVVRETLAAANLGVARSVLGPGPGVLRQASGELRERYLAPLMRGEKRSAFAFTEPSGPDAGRPTWARRDGDELVIEGRKAFVIGGSGVDFYAVMVNVEEDGAGPGGGAVVIVERGTPGLTLGDDFVSLDGATHCQLTFSEVRVPQSNVVGAVGEGMPRALGNIGQMRLALAAQATGTAMWVVEYTREHISKPHRSGTSLGEREQVRAIFGQMVMDAYAARSVLYRSARLAESGDDIINEGAIAKVLATEAAGRIVDQAIQLTGGQALIEGHPLERLYRVTRSWRLAEGASDVLRLNVARGMLEFDAGRV